MFKNWGLKKLDEHEFKESVDEMKHADKLIERILFLEGLPNLQNLGKLLIGENVQECLKCDLQLEMGAHPPLREAIAYCESPGDYISREIVRRYPGERGRAHRLARNPTGPDPENRNSELHAGPDVGELRLTP